MKNQLVRLFIMLILSGALLMPTPVSAAKIDTTVEGSTTALPTTCPVTTTSTGSCVGDAAPQNVSWNSGGG